MANVLVCGGGVCGLATAMMLARDGHDVTVLERDEREPPDTLTDAWAGWERSGVAQFRQAHLLHPRVRHVLDAELPDVRDVLAGEAGAFRHDMVANMPPMISDREPRPDDDRFWTYTARRPTIEWVFARAAADEPRVTIDRGVRASGYITGAEAIDGVPHITGVRTQDGREITADVVIDAMGRRSTSPEWLADVGARPPTEDAVDIGFSYYTRFFQGDAVPEFVGPLNWNVGTFSILTLPGDNSSWSVSLWCPAGDQPLKAFRHPEVFDRVLRALPLYSHWADGTALSDVNAMSGVLDRHRRFVVDGTPVATGLFAVADAWACTNPSAGRGISIGIGHAAQLRTLLHDAVTDPGALAREWDEITEREFAPWYWSQVRSDQQAFDRMEALREGRDPPPPPDDDFSRKEQAFWSAVPFDADVFRAAMEIVGAMTPPHIVYDRRDIMAKAEEIASAQEPLDMPLLSREQLLQLVS